MKSTVFTIFIVCSWLTSATIFPVELQKLSRIYKSKIHILEELLFEECPQYRPTKREILSQPITATTLEVQKILYRKLEKEYEECQIKLKERPALTLEQTTKRPLTLEQTTKRPLTLEQTTKRPLTLEQTTKKWLTAKLTSPFTKAPVTMTPVATPTVTTTPVATTPVVTPTVATTPVTTTSVICTTNTKNTDMRATTWDTLTNAENLTENTKPKNVDTTENYTMTANDTATNGSTPDVSSTLNGKTMPEITTASETVTTKVAKKFRVPQPKECQTARNFTESWRQDHQGSRIKPGRRNPHMGGYNCELVKGNNYWFRFTGDAGNRILNTCPKFMSCGTQNPLWSDGAMPTKVGVPIKVNLNVGLISKGCRTRVHRKKLEVMRCSLDREHDLIYKVSVAYGTVRCHAGFCGME